MDWLLSALGYMVAHFAVYTLALRHLRLFSRESVILGYQAVSFWVHPVVLYAMGVRAEEWVPALTASWALHGIYSLSFLELWSLSEGSYSIQMLDRVDRSGGMIEGADFSDLEAIGSSKKRVRLESLERLGLIGRVGDCYEARARGRILGWFLRVLVWWVNIRDPLG
jgi:hypothetical protein